MLCPSCHHTAAHRRAKCRADGPPTVLPAPPPTILSIAYPPPLCKGTLRRHCRPCRVGPCMLHRYFEGGRVAVMVIFDALASGSAVRAPSGSAKKSARLVGGLILRDCPLSPLSHCTPTPQKNKGQARTAAAKAALVFLWLRRASSVAGPHTPTTQKEVVYYDDDRRPTNT